MTIRLLTSQDASEYQHLRLQSLKESPEAFLSDYKTEAEYATQVFANHLQWSYHPPYLGYFGVFENNKLVGYVQISKTMLDKQNHVIFINNLYIDSHYQRRGFASQLLSYIFELLKKNKVAERAFVSCTAKNKKACHFYTQQGFRRYAVQAKVVKWQDEYDDAIEFVKML